MANISAADVKKLRDLTGAGMMDSKKALEEADGDLDKAVEILRVKGQDKMKKRGEERTASSGLVATAGGALVELNSETDFVAKNEEFVTAAQQIAEIRRPDQRQEQIRSALDAIIAQSVAKPVWKVRQFERGTLGDNDQPVDQFGGQVTKVHLLELFDRVSVFP